MSSFYGGKQGRTYHIVARYDCINLTNYIEQHGREFVNFSVSQSYEIGAKVKNEGEYYFILVEGSFSSADELKNEEKAYHIRGMVQQFAKGGAYTEANYGEYVLIDTIFHLNHKSDLENGLLYRRGFDYNQAFSDKPVKQNFIKNNNLDKDAWQAAWDAWVQKPGAGAIYVGQIVGPQGDSPQITPIKWETLKSINDENIEIKTVIPSSITRGDDNTTVVDSEGNSIWNGDAIKVGSYTERDSDGNVTGAKIAFDIPQTIFDPPSINIDGQTYQGFAEESSGQDGTSSHPFYYKWNFYMPQATDFGLESGQDIGTVVTDEFGNQIIVDENNNFIPDGQGNNVIYNDKYITYEVDNAYDENGNKLNVEHLGRWPYRVIDNIILPVNERPFINLYNGVIAKVGDLYNFQVTTADDNLVCAVCIQGGQVIPQEGQITPELLPKIKGNESSDEYEIGYGSNGEPQQYKIGYESRAYQSLWRVVKIPQAAPASSITVQYKAGPNSDFINRLRSVDYFTLAENGDLYVKYSDSLDNIFKLGNINGLKSIDITDNGIIVEYINGQPPLQVNLKWIDSIKLENQNDITKQQNFIVHYKDETSDEVSQPINTILAIEMQGDNIVALYSDPVYRNKVKTPEGEGRDWFLRKWEDPNLYPDNLKVVYDLEEGVPPYKENNIQHYNKLVWVNLTTSKGTYHVQGEYTYSDLKGSKIGDEVFTIDLSGGFGPIDDLHDRIGWLVTVQDGNTKRIFAFDDFKNANGERRIHSIGPEGNKFNSYWYEIFSLAEESVRPEILMAISDSETQPILKTNGLWFVTYSGHDGNPNSDSDEG